MEEILNSCMNIFLDLLNLWYLSNRTENACLVKGEWKKATELM